MHTPQMIRTTVFASAFAFVAIVASACDKGEEDGDTQAENGDEGTGGDGDGDTSEECEGSVYGENSECTEYITCVETNCGTQYETCFGPDYLNGNFGGSCADYMSCVGACECGDTACGTDCYNTHAAMGTPCGDCLINDIGACVASSCLDAAQSCA